MQTNNNFYFVLAVTLLLVSCKKKSNSDEEVVPSPNTSPSGYFFKADFDGVTKIYSNANSYVNFYGSGAFFLDTNGNVNVSPKAGMSSLSNPEIVSIQFINNIYDSATYNMHADSLFHAVLHMGPYLYHNGPGITGVIIYFADANYCWETSYSIQVGSAFSITSSSFLPDILPHIYHEIEFTFNCKLYDCANTGSTIELKNGTGRLKFEGYK